MAIREKMTGSKINKQLQRKKYVDGHGTDIERFLLSEETQACWTPPAGMKERVLQYVFGEKGLTQD